MYRYNPKEIEPKWQQQWAAAGDYNAIDFSDKPKFVMLTEFPYPSGDGLHLGHMREYTLGDVIARYKRMNGYNVMFPMGYDAFGLPTENYAIKHKIAPQVATERNVGNFQKQFEQLGFSIDWKRSFRTSDPEYYKWTQWLFLKFYEKGLAYQDDISINWCPKCKTGLANEEVVNGRHERCDTLVEKKQLKQWMLKITQYADRLIDGLSSIDYPSRIADQQINWIGRSAGAEIDFEIEGHANKKLRVFTTRPDTLFGATFMVIAPEHPYLDEITNAEHRGTVNSYIKGVQAKSEIERQDTSKDKTGAFTGAYAVNPINGERIPVWTADYVLMGYGTGAIMAVPAHDERDNQFAQQFNLQVRRVISNKAADDQFTSDPGVLINSGEYNGMDSNKAKAAVIAKLSQDGKAKEKINFRLRDWIFSRQHYWGEPIPIIHCQTHGAVAVPADQLPVTLPPVDNYEPTDSGESPLAAIEQWVNTSCPTCGQPARRETDTMPNWAGSSWYYLRYFDAHNSKAFADRKKLDYWGAVDLYLGGMEHTTLHLLYSRFWHQFFYDIGLVPTPEPYAARRGQGIILAADGTKMSKSKGNVINPTEVIESGYGADSLRLAILFLAPYDQTTPWSPEGVAGTYRFINRLWNLVQESTKNITAVDSNAKLNTIIHQTIKKVSQDMESLSFNTAIAAMMEAVNELYKLKEKYPVAGEDWKNGLILLVQLAAPFIPHAAEEMWSVLGGEGTIHTSRWPLHDEKYLQSDSMTIVVQINGKLRATLQVPNNSSEETVIASATANTKIAAFIDGLSIKKTIYIPGKLVNIVI